MLNKKNRFLSLLWTLIIISGLIISQPSIALAVDSQENSETISEKEVPIEEYKQILMRDLDITEEQAEARILPHTRMRGNPHKVYAVSKSKSKKMDSNFKLLCMVTVYVWRDTSTLENLEIDHVAAPYVGISGDTISTDFDGTAEASCTTKKVTVDYNGQCYFETDVSFDLSWAIPVVETSTSVKWRDPVSGQFTWTLSEI